MTASKTNETSQSAIDVDIVFGPIGSGGFRRGYWRFTADGRRGQIYQSIPHGCDLSEQREILTQAIQRAIERGVGIKWDSVSVTIRPDAENNADTFWAALDSAYPAIADELRGRGVAVVDSETWAAIQQLDGFANGPDYAREALIAE